MSETTTTIRVNGETVPLRARKMTDLLVSLGIDPRRQGIAVAVNDEIVPRGEWGGRTIEPGDRIEIVGAVQGG